VPPGTHKRTKVKRSVPESEASSTFPVFGDAGALAGTMTGNELRVSASRSRRRNLVGLNAGAQVGGLLRDNLDEKLTLIVARQWIWAYGNFRSECRVRGGPGHVFSAPAMRGGVGRAGRPGWARTISVCRRPDPASQPAIPALFATSGKAEPSSDLAWPGGTKRRFSNGATRRVMVRVLVWGRGVECGPGALAGNTDRCGAPVVAQGQGLGLRWPRPFRHGA
jgi:hypothetical protein